jgi:nicotinate-nucleotide pyrophosphorylase (carboxylating)
MEGIRELIARALAEDLGSGDITTEALIGPEVRARAQIRQKQPGVLFGVDAAREVFAQTGGEEFSTIGTEGKWNQEVPAAVAHATGPARALLAAERVALNLLGHLSGVATLTARFVRLVEGTEARILDTRKTTPGLRELEKAAVAAGGGENHRMGLYDAVLVKENHIALAGGVRDAVERVRRGRPHEEIEVETRSLTEVSEALAAGARRILLDNMDPEAMAAAVDLARGVKSPVAVEASGGITLENVREVAETGVQFISVGALTHSAPALDLSMLLEPDAGHLG